VSIVGLAPGASRLWIRTASGFGKSEGLTGERKVNKDSFMSLFVFFGLCRPSQMVATILEVILGVSEDCSKKGWRVAGGYKLLKEGLKMLLLVLHMHLINLRKWKNIP
jgi:hypothetical protein